MQLEELENRLTPAGNIVLTNAFLVDSHTSAISGAPDKGEELFTRAQWTTQGLSGNATYKVSYTIDNVTLSTSYFSYGAGGSGTQSWNWYLGGWFASPGTHAVTVTINPDQTAQESNYSDNTIQFNFTPQSATDLPKKFITPLGGAPFQTWAINNYVDVDPRDSTIADFNNSVYTYDGHSGHDIVLSNFSSMDNGVSVYAAADGIVVATQDGNFDRNTSVQNVPANYVEIDHGNGWHTLYYHFRTNTILVHPGDTVVAGQALGLAGSSGYSDASHLHFEVQHNNDVVEPEFDPTTFYVGPLSYQGTLSCVLDCGVTSSHTVTTTDLDARERPVATSFSQAAGQEIVVWMKSFTRDNDGVVFKFYKPDGTHYAPLDYSFTASLSRGGYWYFYKTLPASLTQGTWNVDVEINGIEMDRTSFQVTSAGSGAAHVVQGTTYVPNGRTTPIDFGSVSQGSTPPTLSFTIANLGSAALSLNNLTLPTGYSLVGGFPSSVAVGGSATFSLQMATATGGTKAGVVQFNTSDPNAPSYSFNVQGVVSGGNSGRIHGQVFGDLNNDAMENSPEAGLVGWTVALLRPSDNSVLATTATSFNGYYTFMNLAAASYRVRVTPPSGWSQTTANPADVSVNSTDVLVSPFGESTAVSLNLSGFPSPQIAGVAGNFTVTIQDPLGNPLTGYTGTVHFTSDDPQASLPADYTFTGGDAGTHIFNATFKTAAVHSLTATDTQTSKSATQANITINPAAASVLRVTGLPAHVVAGDSNSFNVKAEDSFGNTASGYTGTIHFTSNDPQAALPIDYKFALDDAGMHTFDVTLKKAGVRSLTATDTANSGILGSQSGITVDAALASVLTVTSFPNTLAGASQSFTVKLKDAFGNLASGYRGTVRFTSSDPQFSLTDYTFLAADSGQHVFSAALYTAGVQSLSATDIDLVNISGSQVGITVLPGSAATFTVAGFPATVAGVSKTFSVTAKDTFGNKATGYTGTVGFVSSDPLFSLANYTFTSGDAGQHSFNGTLKSAGSQFVTVTDTTTLSITGSQFGIVVSPAVASQLTAAGFPSPTTAGVAHSLVVTAKDAFGNKADGYRGTLSFSSSDSQLALANYTFTSADSGQHSFNVTFKTVGTQSVTATDTINNGLTGAQTGIVVNPAAAASFVVAGFPATVAGMSQNFTITVKDVLGNIASGYRGTVKFTSSDGQLAQANYTFTAGDAGQHLFLATLKTAGTQSITAADTATSSITGTEGGIIVNPAAASKLTVAGFPATVAGVSQSFAVTAKDAFGNKATNYTGTVQFASSDLQFSLPNYVFQAGDAGQHSFTATLKTAGIQSITATDSGMSSITGLQSGIAVSPAAAATLIVTGFSTTTTAGATHSLLVVCKDTFGNTATGYTGTVKFSSSDSEFSLPNYTFALVDAGQHSFTTALKTAGTQSITATDTLTSSITGTQSNIVVTAADVATFVVADFPASVAGVNQGFSVTAKDAFGNIAGGYLGTVKFSSSDPQFSLANYTFTAGDAGQHSFSAVLKTAGTQSITTTDATASAVNGTQTGIMVSPAAVSRLVLASFPTSAIAGSAFSFSVSVFDAFGNRATSYVGKVHFSGTDPQGLYAPDFTFRLADAGVHTFNPGVTYKTAGDQTLTAGDVADSTLVARQTVAVKAAQASKLLVTGLPASASSGAPLTYTVTAQDAFGNLATDYRGGLRFLSTDASVSFTPSAYTFTSQDAGKHDFIGGLTFRTPGNQTVTVQDLANTSVTGTGGSVSITSSQIRPVEELFVMGQDNIVYAQKLDANGNPASAYFVTQASPVKALAAGHTANGNPEIFVIGGDDQVYTMKFDAADNIISPYTLTQLGRVRALSVTNLPNGALFLFATNLTDVVFAQKFDANGNSSSAYFVTQNSAIKQFASVQDGRGRPELFVIGGDNQVYAMKFDVNGNPASPYLLTQLGLVSAISLTKDGQGRPELFAMGLSNPVVFGQRFDLDGNSVSAYFLTQASPVKTFATGRTANGNPELFVMGMDSQVYAMKFNADGVASSGFFLTKPGTVKDLAVGVDAQGRPELFVIGADDQVYGQLFDLDGNSASAYFLTKPGKVKTVRLTR